VKLCGVTFWKQEWEQISGKPLLIQFLRHTWGGEPAKGQGKRNRKRWPKQITFQKHSEGAQPSGDRGDGVVNCLLLINKAPETKNDWGSRGGRCASEK